ncbi:pyrimidine dimer DNA glycosylase/endonuclease V [Candidatus Thiodiazotropha sp. CDECU1]|uniref:pyrimidine dimer DNA glycosylase/endonuclease V n=1 Tax=Candidatus Thiodiazotropha sp. CDECU1 TaxID=3065865 RepID=UPI0029303DA8|nr:pyrimidine dimer DNA glycosylase/endonuclease V [Candidatus Thiodiazotropha sp. CDECU1]
MRLWSIHPDYLDAKGLVALWREALLAQKVLQGQTKGYTNHPQLTRFKEASDPLGAIATYLRHVVAEADKRGYKFDKGKISIKGARKQLYVTEGQINYEFNHLSLKLKQRDPAAYAKIRKTSVIKPHPLFILHKGSVEEWEVT